MAQWKLLSAKWAVTDAGVYWHYCPGCKELHPVHVNPPGQVGNGWDWNQDPHTPTLSPSLRHTPAGCHYFLRQGQLQFLSDSHHALAGKTVDLPEIPEGLTPWSELHNTPVSV